MKTCLNAATLLVLSLVLTAITAAQQFIDAPQYSTNSETLVVVNGDFNQDGNPDLAVGSNNAPLLILLGRGNGTFQRGESLGIETTYTQAIILGDWNGDGILDLAVAAYSNGNAVRVYLGVGNGSFTAGAVYPTSQTLVNIVSGDFNGDGVPDLVTSSYDYASSTVCVGVLLGSGDGTFAATGTSQVPGYYSNGLAVGDLNRDGRLDVVDAVASTPSGDNEIEVYLGNGDGSLQAPVSYSTPMEGNAVTLADLNGDGILDLATVWYDLAVLFGKGDGTFAPAQTYIELPGADGIAVADMNGDGSPDLIELHADYSRPGPDAVAVWGNNGDGTFSKPVLYATGYAPLALTVGDLNRDGRPDVVTANYYGKSLSILLSGGGGTLIGQRDYPVYHYGGGSVGPVALGYINADKNLDAVVVDTLGWRVFVLPGNPDGSFQAGQSYWTGDRGAAVALGDVNGDGATDIVTGNCFRTISVLLGDGKGRFKPHVEYTTDTEPHSVVLADVNNDGALDVLTGDFQGKSVSTLLNDGTGVFLP